MPNRQQSGGDSRGLSWIDLDDFTPGLYDASYISAAPGAYPGAFAAPLGSANASDTWQCIALPQGGLGPLPAVVASYTLNALRLTALPSGAWWVGGLINSQVPFQQDELILLLESTSGSELAAYSVQMTHIGGPLGTAFYSNSSGSILNGCPFPFVTRVAATDPTTSVGTPTVVFPDNINPSAIKVVLYPDPAGPTLYGSAQLSPDTAALTFGHQTRIVTLLGTSVAWPISSGLNEPFDDINYTDPPNSETFPGSTPDTIFVAEQPYGYGAVGSVSAGELFMVKTRGGGVVVSGDLVNPTVIYLPGVQPTGYIYGRTDTDENGLYYCSDQAGAYIWNGGNTSTKISLQINDTFYIPEVNPFPYFTLTYFVFRWHDLMLFSNNYVYQPRTNGWWRLLDPGISTFFHYTNGWVGNQIYASSAYADSGPSTFLYKFDNQVPASSWQWQSLPLRVSEDRNVDLREIVVRASLPYGGFGGATIQVTAIDQFYNNYPCDLITIPAGTSAPQMYRLPIRCQSEDIQVLVQAAATNSGQPAPVVHSLSFGYRTRQHSGATV